MHWTETARREYRRACPRYASDLTDREWALIEPFMPSPCRIGRPRKTDLREVVNAVLKSLRHTCPWLRHLFADGAYAGPKLRGALDRIGKWTLEIVKRSDTAKGFEVLPRRWVVERTFAWLGRCRRLAKDWEKSIASSQAWIDIAHILLTTRRLARPCLH